MLPRSALEEAPKVQSTGVQAEPICKCGAAKLLHQSQVPRAVKGTWVANSTKYILLQF